MNVKNKEEQIQKRTVIQTPFDKSEHVNNPPPVRVCFKMKFSFSSAHCNSAVCFYLEESRSREAFAS